MFKKIALVLVAAIAVFLVVVVMQPAAYHVERTAEIEAPPEVVFALLNDFKGFKRWSPWDAKDPSMKTTYGEKTAGVGGSYDWSGNDQVGEGTMTIIESTPSSKVVMRLDFKKPMESTATAGFIIAKSGQGSKTTWYVDGENNFVGKAACLFMDMDEHIGAAYESGLAKLNTIAQEEVVAIEKAKLAAAAAAAAQAKAAAEEAAAAAEAEAETTLAGGKD